MENLTEFIKESLVLNEAAGVFAWTFNHFNPEILQVGMCDKNMASKLNKKLNNYYTYFGTENIKSRYVFVEWNDEKCHIVELGNNIDQYWKKLEKSAADTLKGLTEDDDWEWENDIFCIDSETMREYYKWEDINPEVLVEYIKEYIICSFVDCDSNSCAAILDLQKHEVVLKGSDDIEFVDFTTHFDE